MTPQFWLWLGFAGMASGAAAILFLAKRRTATEEADGIIHGIVPIIAACSYFAMATGQGSLVLPAGPDAAEAARQFYFARYIDWTFTTPLLLVGLARTAMHSGMRRSAVVWGLIGSDLIMIVTAFAFGLSVDPVLKWSWFGISCAAFLGVYYVLWIPNLQANKLERDDTRKTYRTNASMLSVLWFLYPFVLAASPDGLGIVGDATAILGIAILDVLSKVVYGLLAVSSDTKATDRDLAEGPIVMDTRQGRTVTATA